MSETGWEFANKQFLNIFRRVILKEHSKIDATDSPVEVKKRSKFMSFLLKIFYEFKGSTKYEAFMDTNKGEKLANRRKDSLENVRKDAYCSNPLQ